CACVDDAEQTELFKRCETILTEQAANLYIQDLCDLVAMKSTLDGYKFYPIYAMDLSTVYYK
ncbi:MAG: ABC transporter substrate-binding protein, partial [Oscillospiraceae bacterium]|nr:ABC transporter substrate-binding protein [Oscillospiraceae bacterium]